MIKTVDEADYPLMKHIYHFVDGRIEEFLQHGDTVHARPLIEEQLEMHPTGERHYRQGKDMYFREDPPKTD